MEFRVPFTAASKEKLKRRSSPFLKYARVKKEGMLQQYLQNDDAEFTAVEYRAVCIRSAVFALLLGYIFSAVALFLFNIRTFLLLAIPIAFLFSVFIYLTQINYPKIYDSRRQKNIDKNLIPALEDMLVQLNSGIPLFNILVNLSSTDYGELSVEFKKAVKEINGGVPQIEVLEGLGEKNTSQFFRRTLWQVSNGMRAGSDISIIIRESIRALNEEQLIQIQNYGNKLNPLIMFYMLVAVIIPALSVTFITILSSMVSLPEQTTYTIFGGLFIVVTIIQIMFVGVIRSLRPSLL